MPASASSFRRGLRPDTGVSVSLSPNNSPPKISTDCVRACSCATVGALFNANAAITGKTKLRTACLMKRFAGGRALQRRARDRRYGKLDSDMTPPKSLVNSSPRLEERDLQWNPISLDRIYRG